ncbi:hypothetical protein [Sulfitobacter donghicola]|uniref:Uncharacterized protein n=1 Tax=Sulfitobacter donghicola DSW-25 = KCTC 12864 = JCM 14565 TaxID=1300350 RepID=A0A073ITZ1_9RHOB|nr:hypothetical protein [Sulfitobacter donghicola]KEJ88872.1 hypothetical protein DSW25_13470 [Sulfitobacter donghicola DSW-25 = KCTC 12864 = JCM 14565]KIN68438.1 hypothetical protein Z948_2168 [Sulfitobacter donghicola DSW-25 = KCTC 12864 = JCM 14565]
MDTGFFKWLWRFNAAAIALCLLFALIMILSELSRDLTRNLFSPRTTNTLVAPVDDSEEETVQAQEKKRFFGALSRSGNANIYAVPLFLEQDISTYSGISKSSTGNRINYRIVNMNTQSSRWLFEGMDRLILETRQILTEPNGGTPKFVGQLIEVVEEDTNNDTRLSARDTRSLYLTTADWSEPKKILNGVRMIFATQAQGNGVFDIIYSTTNQTHAARIDMETGNVLSSQTLPHFE